MSKQRRLGRGIYPIDWHQLSDLVRAKAGWVCSRCKRPHKTMVETVADGRWRLLGGEVWTSELGKKIAAPTADQTLKQSYTVLSSAHRDHRQGASVEVKDLICLCRRCHLIHDEPWHYRERMLTLRSRRALGDLFGDHGGPWPARYPR